MRNAHPCFDISEMIGNKKVPKSYFFLWNFFCFIRLRADSMLMPSLVRWRKHWQNVPFLC